jgi:hypothetical protein
MTEENAIQSVEDITSAILSFNDINLVVATFESLEWNLTTEIVETLKIVKQDKQLAPKLNAIKHLRLLLKEAAEAAGMMGNVTQTVPGEGGGHTTFSAHNVLNVLNPKKKQISSIVQETINEQPPGEDNRRSPTIETALSGGEGDLERPSSDQSGANQPRGFPTEGGTEDSPIDGIEFTDQYGEPGRVEFSEFKGCCERDGGDVGPLGDSEQGSEFRNDYVKECCDHKPPTCNQDLYPGVSKPTPPSAE